MSLDGSNPCVSHCWTYRNDSVSGMACRAIPAYSYVTRHSRSGVIKLRGILNQ